MECFATYTGLYRLCPPPLPWSCNLVATSCAGLVPPSALPSGPRHASSGVAHPPPTAHPARVRTHPRTCPACCPVPARRPKQLQAAGWSSTVVRGPRLLPHHHRRRLRRPCPQAWLPLCACRLPVWVQGVVQQPCGWDRDRVLASRAWCWRLGMGTPITMVCCVLLFCVLDLESWSTARLQCSTCRCSLG